MHAVDPFLTSLFGLVCSAFGAAIAWGVAWLRSHTASGSARRDPVWETEVPDWFQARLDDIESRASYAPWVMRGVRGVAEEAARQRLYGLGSRDEPSVEVDE
jgi:hypothetical protein